MLLAGRRTRRGGAAGRTGGGEAGAWGCRWPCGTGSGWRRCWPPCPGRHWPALHSPRDGQLDPAAALAALAADGRAAGDDDPGGGRRRPWRPGAAAGGWPWPAAATWRPPGWCWRPGAGRRTPAGGPAGIGGHDHRGWSRCWARPWSWSWRPPCRTPGRAAVVWRGLNLVPRPDLEGGRRLWLGATLEPGRTADAGQAQPNSASWAARPRTGWPRPGWCATGRACGPARSAGRRPCWSSRPLALLLAGGHYRNGVLLAPASADWVAGVHRGPQPAATDPPRLRHVLNQALSIRSYLPDLPDPFSWR